MTTNTTPNGVLNNDAPYELEDAADALLNRWTDAEKPSEDGKETEVKEENDTTDTEEAEDDETEEQEQTEEETDEEADEEAEEESDTENEESDKDEPNKDKAPKVLEDDTEVEITVGDEKKKVAVKDLKRLYGQEAALTRKSQEVATQRKAVETQAAKHAAVLDQLFQRAQAKWEPYAKVDMLLASKELDSESFAALRAESQAAYEEFQFVSIEADKFMQEAQARQQEQIKMQAQEAVKVLKEKIPNWSNELYDKLRTYAVTNGFDPEVTARITDPSAIMMLYKAQLYDAGKNIKLKAKAKTPTKVIKSGNMSRQDVTPNKTQAAMKKLQTSGTVDDAVDAFMARWEQ